jgi:hypothetical protein
MDDGTTYDVRVYRTEAYKGVTVSTYKVRWRTGRRLWKEGLPECSAHRQLPKFPADRSSEGRGIQSPYRPPGVVGP